MHYNRHTTRSPHHIASIGYRGEDMPESYHGYEVGTFPRKRENPRFRYQNQFFYFSIGHLYNVNTATDTLPTGYRLINRCIQFY